MAAIVVGMVAVVLCAHLGRLVQQWIYPPADQLLAEYGNGCLLREPVRAEHGFALESQGVIVPLSGAEPNLRFHRSARAFGVLVPADDQTRHRVAELHCG
ncbi:hypothetical protein D5S17_36060 [Pseudonocardiaceae bacterium YIM PH 21723]|nr:hypothetical protein D5S17_36060 [Pseudonocardiaceae bacterium YIM PH 21723]